MTRRRTETALDYRLHLEDGKWKVFGIIQASSYTALLVRPTR